MNANPTTTATETATVPQALEAGPMRIASVPAPVAEPAGATVPRAGLSGRIALGLVGMLTAKDPKAKSNAQLVTIISGVLSVVGVILQVAGVIGGAAVRR